jgi:CHAD domain-containing protein
MTKSYSIPDTLSDSELFDRLAAVYSLSKDSEQSQLQTYFDSFDWRIYGAGGVIVQSDQKPGPVLEWRDRGTGVAQERFPVTGDTPRFSWDFPAGGFKARLEPALEMRALLPVVELESRSTVYRLRNKDEKTVLRLVLDRCGCRNPGSREFVPMGRYLRLLPLKGYDRPYKKIQAFLCSRFELSESAAVPLDAALAALGRRAEDYSSKLNFKLVPDQRADVVTKQILLHLLNVMESNVPGTLKDLDSEFLHDLRVAVRRTRSALSQIKDVFLPEEIEEFKSRLAWVGQVSGPTRDMDVYLLDFPTYQNTLPPQYRQDLEPLRDFLNDHQKIEQQVLVKKLRSPHFRTLLKEWREFLETPPPRVALPANAVRPIREVADRRIKKMFKLVLDEGLAIHDESEAEELHELRKSCKKLRYLMEFFQNLYPQKEIRFLIKELKRLLDNLGDFQDLEVQAEKLRDFAHQMVEEGAVPADTLLAMGMLVDDLLARQHQAYQEFFGRFAQFAAEDNRAVLSRLLKGKPA